MIAFIANFLQTVLLQVFLKSMIDDDIGKRYCIPLDLLHTVLAVGLR